MLASGCGKTEPVSEQVQPITADGVMQSMVDAYQSAATYQDRGVVRFSYRRDGRVL